MKKIDLGQTITVLANVGVIAGIAFLGFELSQNNDLLAAQARYNLIVQRADMNDNFQDPYLIDALHKLAGGGDVTPAERSAALLATVKLVEMWEWQFHEYTAGMLERQQLPIPAWRLWYHGEGELPIPVGEVWERRKGVASPNFVEFMEENVVNER